MALALSGLKNKSSSDNELNLACRLIIEQVRKTCPNVNLSSIVIKTTSSSCEQSQISNNNILSSTDNIKQEPSSFTTIKLNDLKSNSSVKESPLLFNLDSSEITVSTSKSPLLLEPSGEVKTEISKKPRLSEINSNQMNSELRGEIKKEAPSLSTAGSVKAGATLATGRRSKDIEVRAAESVFWLIKKIQHLHFFLLLSYRPKKLKNVRKDVKRIKRQRHGAARSVKI